MTDIVLLTPPPDMRQACCDGLAAREQAGKGGTARSVPFASRVCAGGPVTADDLVDMLTHMAAIADAMIERGLGDRALAVAWDLWGGDAGREWAEAFVYRPAPVMAAPTPAAPVEVEVVKVRWVDDLNRLARGERELLARIHELMEAGVEIAVNRLRHKVVNGLQRPSAALKAAFSGLHHRDELLAAIAAAEDDVAAVRCLPSPILARLAPGIESDEKLRAVFGQLGQRITTLVGDHQRKTIDVLRDAGASATDLVECSTLMAADLSMAVDMATAELMDLIGRLARDEADDPQGEVPLGKVASSLAFRLLSAAGGGDPGDGTRQDWVHVGRGEVLCAGVALGVTSLRLVGRLIGRGDALLAAPSSGTLSVNAAPEMEVQTVTTWRWGGSSRPFPPHQRLNGESWVSEDERKNVLANRSGDEVGEPSPVRRSAAVTPGRKVSKTAAAVPDAKWEAPLSEELPWRPEGWVYSGSRPAGAQSAFAYENDAAAIERAGNPARLLTKKNAAGQAMRIEVYGNASTINAAQFQRTAAQFQKVTEKYPMQLSGKGAVMRIVPIADVDGFSVMGSGEIHISHSQVESDQTDPYWQRMFMDKDRFKGTGAPRPAESWSFRGAVTPSAGPGVSTVTHEWGHAQDFPGNYPGAPASTLKPAAVAPFEKRSGLTVKPRATAVQKMIEAGETDRAATFYDQFVNPKITGDDVRATVAMQLGDMNRASKYAWTNNAEMVAEAMTDWVHHPDAPLESTKLIAKAYGWLPWTP